MMSQKEKKETDYREMFRAMGLTELLDWGKAHESDWDDDDIPKWSDPLYREIERKAPEAFRRMEMWELLRFAEQYREEDMEAWSSAWVRAMKKSWPFTDIYDRLSAIETSIDVILMAIGDENAGINMKQLIKLKGGYYPGRSY